MLGNISFGPFVKTPSFGNFDKFFVGFDEQLNKAAKMHETLSKNHHGTTNYPPYNIFKTSESAYVIEMAVAGFTRQNIDMEIDDGRLIVRGNIEEASQPQTDVKDAPVYLWKGIASRNFERAFIIDNQIEIQDAVLKDGMLKIYLQSIIPEHKKPKKIIIKDSPEKRNTKTFLSE